MTICVGCEQPIKSAAICSDCFLVYDGEWTAETTVLRAEVERLRHERQNLIARLDEWENVFITIERKPVDYIAVKNCFGDFRNALGAPGPGGDLA